MVKRNEPTDEQVALARAIVSEMARRAGSTKSPKRAAASRLNGKKGGRPRKAKA
jgi:hypothetical protein